MIFRSFFSGLRQGMHLFGENIALIVNSAVLLVVYLVGVGVTAVIAKIVRKQFLALRPSKQTTYWSDMHLSKKPIEEYYRQF